MVKQILVLLVFLTGFEAHASLPLSDEVIAKVETVLPRCKGGPWVRDDTGGIRRMPPSVLLPRLRSLAQPSSELGREEGKELYDIAKALIAPAIQDKSGFLDPTSGIKCMPFPKEGIAIFEFLVGHEPDDLKAPTNAFMWLAHAYANGLAGKSGQEKARLYFLRWRVHSNRAHAQWSDGIDNDLIANIERAGMRPYLEELSKSETWQGAATARMILAEEALKADPVKARELLRVRSSAALRRLLDLEEQGLVQTRFDPEDIAFWAKMAQASNRKWSDRMAKGVELFNGGEVQTVQQKPSIKSLRPHLNLDRVSNTQSTRGHIPVRALVDPTGRAIYVEACKATSEIIFSPLNEHWILRNAALLYNVENLPRLPVSQQAGKRVYGWVILPAVKFDRDENDKLVLDFVNVSHADCRYPDIRGAIQPPSPPRHVRSSGA